MEIIVNPHWENHKNPFFTVITPVYNRRSTIGRTMISVEKQTFSPIEYIIIDDGSTAPSDDLISEFMNSTRLPVMYIKKENGGVHTARNVGIDHANGKFLICIDSDDELVPDACQDFYDEWTRIPDEEKENVWQIKALCIDQDGKMVSSPFPDDINSIEPQKAKAFFSMSSGEQLGCRSVQILKDNKFPEPRWVKFVNENNLWVYLESKYRSWGMNKVVRIYHTEGDNRLSNVGKKTVQNCIDSFWNSFSALENADYLIHSKKEYLFEMLRYNIMRNILRKRKPEVSREYRISAKKARLWSPLMYLPARIGAILYVSKRME